MAHYLLYIILGTGISWLVYHLLLRKEKCFVFNRFYLLASLLLCLAAPLLEIDLGKSAAQIPRIPLSEMTVFPVVEAEAPANTTASFYQKEVNVLPVLLLSVYVFITLIFLLRFFNNLRKIAEHIRKSERIEVEGLYVLSVNEKSNPSSFFHYLFLNRDELEKGHLPESIIKHEAAHSGQLHSADVLLLEFISCFLWLNPFIWLYKKAVIRNHEYLADAAVLRAGVDAESYSYDLIKAGDKNRYLQLISGFNFIQTKNRLMMMHSEKSSTRLVAFKMFLVTSLFAVVFLFSSYSSGSNKAALKMPVENDILENSSEEVNTGSEDISSGTKKKQVPAIPFAVVEEPPLFPGCEDLSNSEGKQCTSRKITGIVQENLSEQAMQLFTLPAGNNVFVQFRIDENGRVAAARARATSPQLSSQEKAALENEAIEAVNAIPQMKPARHEGQAVGVLYAVRL